MNTKKVIAYQMRRDNCPGIMHIGTTPSEVASAMKNEIDANEGLGVEEIDNITIEAYETTMEEIETLDDFAGW